MVAFSGLILQRAWCGGKTFALKTPFSNFTGVDSSERRSHETRANNQNAATRTNNKVKQMHGI